MSMSDKPHFEISSTELATWLERQPDQWWTVDNDPLLMGRLDLPGPAEELAAELRRINRPLLVEDLRPHPEGKGEVITADKLDDLTTPMWGSGPPGPGEKPIWVQDRVLYFSWKGSSEE